MIINSEKVKDFEEESMACFTLAWKRRGLSRSRQCGLLGFERRFSEQ
jgi:hypothetical protein